MVYQVGEFHLSPERYELSRDGTRVRLEPRVFEVLSYLVANRDRLVTKNELLEALWRGQVVSESALTRTISAARRALGGRSTAGWIRSVYGRGFIFKGPVRELPDPASPRSPLRPRSRALPSVAVLPFADLSRGRDQEHFCDGLAEELRSALARLDGLAVASRTSALQLAHPGVDVRIVAERTNVAAVLEGTVRRDGRGLRVAVRLIDAADNYVLWSATFDRNALDLLTIQAEIAERVATALQVVLTDQERAALRRPPPAGLEAYDYYLRGRQRCTGSSGRTLEAGRQMYLRAMEADPEYAPAYAGFSDCCAFIYLCWGGSPEDLAAADAASRRALALDPELAEAHVARAHVLAIQGDGAAASQAIQRALRLKPRLPKIRYIAARFEYMAGRSDIARDHLEFAETLGAHTCEIPHLLGRVYESLGYSGEARAARLRAIAMAEVEVDHDPDDARPWYLGASALVATGQVQRGLEWIERSLRLAPDDQVALVYAAVTLSRTGHRQRARHYLDRALALDFRQLAWLARDPDLAALRNTSSALRNRVGRGGANARQRRGP
jgi:TolB-like protein/Flp pilus assembly protein TadD